VQKTVFPRSQKLPSAHPLFNHELKTIFQSQSNQAIMPQGIATKRILKTILKARTVFHNLETVTPLFSIS